MLIETDSGLKSNDFWTDGVVVVELDVYLIRRSSVDIENELDRL